MAAAIDKRPDKLSEHTNNIQDGTNRRAIYDSFMHAPPRTVTVQVGGPGVTLSTAKAAYAPILWDGYIDRVYAVCDAAITGAHQWSFAAAQYSGAYTTFVGSTWTTVTGATAGITKLIEITGGTFSVRRVKQGGTFRVTNAGNAISTGTGPTGATWTFTAMINIE